MKPEPVSQPQMNLWQRFCHRVTTTFRRQRGGPAFNSLKFEISVLYALILGIILIVFSGVLYMMLYITLYKETDSELRLKAQSISQSITLYMETRGETESRLKHAVETVLNKQTKRLNNWWIMGFERRWLYKVEQLDIEETYLNFVAPDGTALGQSSNMPESLLGVFMSETDFSRVEDPFFRDIRYEGRKMRMLTYPFDSINGERSVIQVGVYQKPVHELVFNWLRSVIVSIPAMLLLTSFIGWMLAKRILGSVERISQAARRITREDLRLRVEPAHSYVEMKTLIDDFNNMISRLEQSFRHIEEFSAHVAHELKTPLTIIRGEAEVSLLEDRAPEYYKRSLKVTQEESEKMLKLIEDLLYISKLDYHSEVFHFQPLDLTAFLGEVTEQVKLLAEAKQITVESRLPGTKLMIQADPIHLRRLFYNLIDNAIKFTPSGGRVDITLERRDRQARVSVSDTGRGIPPGDIEKIFEKFFRVDSAEPGNGLGLNMAHSIAQLHQGEIRVESRPGRGAVFTVFLPLDGTSPFKLHH